MIGIILAFGAVFSWTSACFLWRKQTKYFSALQFNLIKNLIGLIIFSPILLTIDFILNSHYIILLFLSGFLGISVADSFYIAALKRLGTRRTLTFDATSPIFAAFMGSLILGEAIYIKGWLGIIIISFSLIGISFERNLNEKNLETNLFSKDGYIYAFLSVFFAVLAALISRSVLQNSELSPFQTSFIRLLAGFICLIPFFRLSLFKEIQNLNTKNKSILIFSTILGTNIGILLQQNVFQLLPVGLGWTLLSTSPVVSIFFAKLEGEVITWKSLLLSGAVVLGVGILFM
tara:strand:+ start:3504 stop:4370 length:867 start_codon:yes stop_codon:yes gene_type:complete